jgi:hypothetical protein
MLTIQDLLCLVERYQKFAKSYNLNNQPLVISQPWQWELFLGWVKVKEVAKPTATT